MNRNCGHSTMRSGRGSSSPARIRVRQIYFGGDADHAYRRALAARDAIAHGTPFAAAQAGYSDPGGEPIPDAMIPLHELRGLLGPTLAGDALAMRPGEISAPLESPSGCHILYLLDFEPERILSYEDARPRVEDEYLRRAPDDALQALLDRLRRNASITLAPYAPR